MKHKSVVPSRFVMFTRRAIKNFILHRVNYQTVCLFVDTMLVNRTFLFVILLHFIFQDLTLCKFQPVYHRSPDWSPSHYHVFFFFLFFFFFFLFPHLNSFLKKKSFRWTRQDIENNVLKFMRFFFICYKWNIYIFSSPLKIFISKLVINKNFLILHQHSKKKKIKNKFNYNNNKIKWINNYLNTFLDKV